MKELRKQALKQKHSSKKVPKSRHWSSQLKTDPFTSEGKGTDELDEHF